MKSINARQFLRISPAGWLLAALLATLVWRAYSQTSTLADSRGLATPGAVVLAMPKVAADRRQDLPAVFRQRVPTSVADLRAMQQLIETLTPKISPAVVAVEVGYSSASGVVISADGLVLTAGHVCEWPNRDVKFEFPDGKTARGKTLGLNEDADTGLMKITGSGPWPHVALGDLDHAHLGDWVLALGHPDGFDVKRSLVVRLGRVIRAAPGVLQTDCTISPGDSGGPLFDMQGRVIGIHTAISSSTADNFHVAITEFYDDWDLLAKGTSGEEQVSAPRSYIGASGANDPAGCRLTEVDEHSPASRAGLKAGDVVLKVNGREIKVSAAFRRWVDEAKLGETLSLDIKRGEEMLSVKVKVEAAQLMQP